MASAISAGILGTIVALNYQPHEGILEINGPLSVKYVKQQGGPYNITYLSEGPTLTSFYTSCGGGGLYDFGGFQQYNCINFSYDGGPGLVQLLMPARLVGELEKIQRVETGFHSQLSFHLVSQDEVYTRLRINLPAAKGGINLVGGTEMAPIQLLIFDSTVFGGVLFMAILFATGAIGSAIFSRRKKLVDNH